MKRLTLIIFLCFSKILVFGQPNFCKYFKLNVEQTEYEGKKAISITPEIINFKSDSFSNFLTEHKNRFEYILYNKLDSIIKYSKLYPDTNKIKNQFCLDITNNKKINNYFLVLSGTNEEKISFSDTEMMLIASRFFLCDKINKIDTSIGYHICIGINGQKELNLNRDYTILEAFCFEAIFSYYKTKRPLFVDNFNKYLNNGISEYKENFDTFENCLEYVRKYCFKKMENDKILKKSLLKFYRKNKQNLGFTIN